MRSPIATDTAGARAYLGITTDSRWNHIRARVPKLGRDWYSYADLDEFLAKWRNLRDNGEPVCDADETEVIDFEKAKGKAKAGRKVRGKGNRPDLRTPEKFLRPHAG